MTHCSSSMPPSHAQQQLGSIQHTCFRHARPCRSTALPRQRLAVIRAQNTDSVLDKMKGLFGQGPKEEEDRFKYDFANSRWIRVKAEKDSTGKYKTGMWEEGGGAYITPLAGSPYLVWPVIHSRLTRRGLKSITAEEALRLQKKGVIILDVRPTYQYEKERIEGSVNVPMFRPVAGKDNWSRVKKIVMGSLAMAATERDPDFGANAARQLDKRKKVIVYCGRGGTIKTGFGNERSGKFFKDDPERAFGIETRSLKGCYELYEAGFKDVVHLEGGLSQWRYEGLPLEYD